MPSSAPTRDLPTIGPFRGEDEPQWISSLGNGQKFDPYIQNRTMGAIKEQFFAGWYCGTTAKARAGLMKLLLQRPPTHIGSSASDGIPHNLYVDADGVLWMTKRLKPKATSEMTGAQFEMIGHIDWTKQRVNYRAGQNVYNAPSFGLPCALNHLEVLGASGYHLPGLRWVISQLGQIAAQQTGLPIKGTHVSIGGFITLVMQRYLVLLAMEAAKVAIERAGLTWEGPTLFEDPLAVTKACTSFTSGCLLERELIELLTGLMLPRVGILTA
jgi:hypothetical protein